MLFVLLLVLASCGGTTEPSAGCGSDVGVQVSAGSRPVVSWSSTCPAIGVRIADGTPLFNNDLPIWEIVASTSLIRPAVTYGASVPGTTSFWGLVAPPDLAIGRSYVAYVSIGELGGTPIRRDSLRFTAR